MGMQQLKEWGKILLEKGMEDFLNFKHLGLFNLTYLSLYFNFKKIYSILYYYPYNM